MIDIIFIDEPNDLAEVAADRLRAVENLNVMVSDTVAEGEKMTASLDSVVLVIGPRMPLDSAIGLVGRFSGRSGVGCILLADELSTALLQSAFRAGFRDVLHYDSEELEAAIERVNEQLGRNTAQTELEVPAVGPNPGKVITLLSAKGGSGKTVIASNLAVGLAKRQEGRVILLDLDFQFGDVGVMLGLPPEPNTSELPEVIERIDEEMLRGFLSKHESGVEALLAPAKMEITQKLDPSQIDNLIRVATSCAEFVIIDTACVFDDNIVSILNRSDSAFLTATLDVPSIKDAQIILHALRQLRYPDARMHLLLNRADSKVSLTAADVEKHLRHDISVQIPSDRSVPISVNEGVPLLGARQRRPIDDALHRVVALAMSVQKRGEHERLTIQAA